MKNRIVKIVFAIALIFCVSFPVTGCIQGRTLNPDIGDSGGGGR